MTRVSHFSRSEITATFAAGTAAILITGLQPVLLGAIAREDVMTFSGAGALAGLEAFSIGIGLIFATLLSKTDRFRVIVMCALAVLAFSNFACAVWPAAKFLYFLRSITGLMSGVIIWAATSVLVRTKFPGRITGYFVATYTAVQGICVLVLALYLMITFDWRSCFLLMGSVSVLALFFAFYLPQRVTKLPKTAKMKLQFSLPVTCACLIVFLQLIAFMSIWTFLEPIGERGGKTAQTIQILVSASLFVQVLGAATGGYLADKVPAALILAIASICIIVIGVYFFSISPEAGQFFYIASLSFSFLWMLILPFHTQLAINIESSGNLALNIPILQILGSVAAPLLGGVLVLDGDVRNVMRLTLSCSIAALLLTVLMIILWKHRAAITTH